MKYRYLNDINSPEDLKKLPDSAMPELAEEIRDFLIKSVGETGGHLASNLGVVELTLALHRNFDLPKDHIIWDVGHQSYVHKIITGRKNEFSSLRKIGGLSGFTKREESEYDCFGTGHSSTSLSAALGFAHADKLNGTGGYTIAVVGDGAYTGGMIHEAINNIRRDLRLILILNENEMSISKNIGKFAKQIARLRSSKSYYRTKRHTARFIYRIPVIGPRIFRGIRRIKQNLKNIMYGSNYFEDIGIYYLGPVDGNDYEKLSVVLEEAKKASQSVIVHIKTKKGKGYLPAEAEPNKYHSVCSNNGHAESSRNFSLEFGNIIADMAREDDRICAITAAMGESTGLELFSLEYKNRFFDVGIAEAHALTFAAGLAADGMIPVFAVYSSFLQRGYDNIIHDIALQKLPVIICADRAGLSAGDGPTHHGIYDVAFVSHSGITIYAPSGFLSLKDILTRAIRSSQPTLIRYSNCSENREVISHFFGNGFGIEGFCRFHADYSVSEAKDRDIIIITYGRIVSEALKLQKQLRKRCGIILLEQLNPYADTARLISEYIPDNKNCRVLFWEEGIYAGGAGMLLGEELLRGGYIKSCTYNILAVKDSFRPIRTSECIYDAYGIGLQDAMNIIGKTDGGMKLLEDSDAYTDGQ